MQTRANSSGKMQKVFTSGGWHQTVTIILFIVLLTALLVSSLWHHAGIPGGESDLILHIHRAAAVQQSFEQGVFWPRWVPNIYQDLGAPVFHHYGLGLYWLVAAVHWTGIRLDTAFKIVITCAFLLSGLGLYGWIRKIFSQPAALAGASLFLTQPYFISAEYYYLGFYAEMLALLLLPVCLWAVTALHFRPSAWHWFSAVSALSALVLSHNLTTVTGAVVLLLLWLFLALVYKDAGGLARCALAALTATLVTAVFWLPAFADLPLVQFENALNVRLNYKGGFFSLRELTALQPAFLDSRAGNPLTPPSFTFGAAQWSAVLVGLASVFVGRRRDRRLWGLAGALFACLCLALTMPFSEPLWNSIPWLHFLQFRFRLLPLATLGSLSAAALAIDVWPVERRWIPAFVLLLGSILLPFPYLFPDLASFTSFWSADAIPAKDAHQNQEPAANWDIIAGSGEFLVRGADMAIARGFKEKPEAASLHWYSPHRAVADLPAQTGPHLLRLHFHPGWSAGENVALVQGTAGWTQVTGTPEHGGQLELRWEGTTSQRWGEHISLLGLFATALGFTFFARQRRAVVAAHQGGNLSKEKRAFLLVVIPMTACVFLVLLMRYAIDRYSEGPFLWHSAPGNVPFRLQGEPTVFGDASTGQMTLLGWKLLSSPTPRPGDSIVLRLFWQANKGIDEDLNTLLHLYSPALQHSWATDAQGTIRLPTRIWDPDKYYIETMVLPIPPDVPPLTYSLAAGLTSPTSGRLAVPGSESRLLTLREMKVAPLRPGMFQRVRPTTETPAETADSLRLQGYDLSAQGDDLTLRLFWETKDRITNDWTTYIHMLDNTGELVAQFDGPPLTGLQPTSQWHRDALYVDRREITLPSGLTYGDYLFHIGLYNFTTGERLPLQPRDIGDIQFKDGQLLVPLAVQPSEAMQDSCYICSGDQ